MKIEVLEKNIGILKRDVKLNRVCAWAHAVLTGITGVKLVAYGKDWTFAFVVNVGLFALRIGVLVHKRKELAKYILIRDTSIKIMEILDANEEDDKIIPFPKTK